MERIKFTWATVVVLFLVPAFLHSCSSSKNNTYWVSGIKTECSAGAGKAQCLTVYKGNDLANAQRENFYAPIEGFVFEEGFFKKIKVKEEKLPAQNVPADASSIKYTLIKELEKTQDKRSALNGKWTLTEQNGNPINRSIVLPILEIDVTGNNIYGTGGCNRYNAAIKTLTQTGLAFGPVMSTRMACNNENIETQYFKALEQVSNFNIEGNMLHLSDAGGNKLLSFIK